MIKVVICDGDGTLGLPSPSPEIREMVKSLPSLGVQLAVASNSRSTSAIRNKIKRAGLPEPAFIVTPPQTDSKKSKPSPEFVYKIRDLAQVELNEIIYLGDDDRTDIFCAVNAGVLPFTAKYSTANKPRKYGIPLTTPKNLLRYLSTFGKQDAPYFGWMYDGICPDTQTPIDVRTLLGDHSNITGTLKRVLKDQVDARIGSGNLPVRGLLYHYLVSQCYLSGLTADVDWVTVYPGHKKDSKNATLGAFSRKLASIFKDRFKSNLLVRHTDAPKSQHQGTERNIITQFQTLVVNSDEEINIQGKRILVLDDFTTAGFSLETARRLLLQAGASSVVGIAIAKYRRNHAVTQISTSWNPFNSCTLTQDDITVFSRYGTSNHLADEYFYNNIWSEFSA